MQKVKCSRCGTEMDCPENMVKAEKHICAKCVDEIAPEEFVNLDKLLRNDTSVIKEIKTLLDKEKDYEEFLGPVEYTIAEHFLEGGKLKDNDVVKSLKNIKKNYTEDISFFDNALEKEIMLALSCALQDRCITHHELGLVLNYLLWYIDNRSWMQDKQAYVKWIAYFFELYEDNEMKKYEESFKKFAKRMGIPQQQVNSVLMKDFDNLQVDEEKDRSLHESEFFSLEDNEKFDFVIEHGLDNPYLIKLYSKELDEKKDYETAEKLYKRLLETAPEFPPFECSLGALYKKIGNPYLAKHHLDNASKSLERVPDSIIPEEAKKELRKEIEKELESVK